MLAEEAGPDQREAKKMRPGHCTKKTHPGSPEVTFLGTDTSFDQSHPTLLEKYLLVSRIPRKESRICQKEVHCIYVLHVSRIRQKEFGICQKEVHCVYV